VAPPPRVPAATHRVLTDRGGEVELVLAEIRVGDGCRPAASAVTSGGSTPGVIAHLGSGARTDRREPCVRARTCARETDYWGGMPAHPSHRRLPCPLAGKDRSTIWRPGRVTVACETPSLLLVIANGRT
jgi:hypothetical protein